MRSEIIRMKLEKILSVRLLSAFSTKQPVIKKAMEMQAEAEHRRSDGNPQNEINVARKATFNIQAHKLSRSRSAQEINKHVSDGVYKHPVENKCDFEAKDFSKSEAELVDVNNTLQT